MKKIPIVITALLLALLASGNSRSAPLEKTISAQIDASYQKLWKEKQIVPSQLSSDEEFLRRVYLDITGRIPTAAQAESFLKSEIPLKREKLILRLVNSPEFAEYYASLWTALFLGYKNDQYVNRAEFQKWLENKLRKDAGWDEISTELIRASGSLSESPPLNWYARHRMEAADLADDTSRIFLGIQLGCARCHDHPHEKWKLEDFYGIAAFYGGIKKSALSRSEKMQRKQLRTQRQEMMEKYKTADAAKQNEPETVKQMREEFRGLMRLAEEPSSSITAEVRGKNETYPAKFLLNPEPAHITEHPRTKLAAWIVSPQNPYFVSAFVNRIWGLMMGKGFVHPVDDMGGLNKPSNPELLKELSDDFQQNRYNIKRLVYTIAASQTYQLSSHSSKEEPPEFYERGKVQMLNPDQLMNSFLTATSVETALKILSHREFEERKQLIYLHHVFLFDNDDTRSSVEFEGTIPQALFLLNGKLTNEAIQPLPENTISEILRNKSRDHAWKVDRLYLHTLSRRATSEEIEALGKNGKRDDYEDLFWALLNSNEFLFNH